MLTNADLNLKTKILIAIFIGLLSIGLGCSIGLSMAKIGVLPGLALADPSHGNASLADILFCATKGFLIGYLYGWLTKAWAIYLIKKG